MPERSIISPQEQVEYRKLAREYWEATTRAAEAMRTAGAQGNNAAWQRVLADDAVAAKALKRMKEIRREP